MVQYYFKGSTGSNVGPISADEFRQRQEGGEIEGETMVWRSGMGEWTTYSAMCAAELLAATPAPQKAPPPLVPVAKPKPRPAEATKRTGFHACGVCGKDWPEGLLFKEGSKRVCGNCQTRLKEQAQDAKPKAGAGTGLAGFFFIAIAIGCAGGLAYKVTHPGPPVAKQRAAELTSASTYGSK